VNVTCRAELVGGMPAVKETFIDFPHWAA